MEVLLNYKVVSGVSTLPISLDELPLTSADRIGNIAADGRPDNEPETTAYVWDAAGRRGMMLATAAVYARLAAYAGRLRCFKKLYCRFEFCTNL